MTATAQDRGAMVLRLSKRSSRDDVTCPHAQLLAAHGVQLFECPTLEAVRHSMQQGCRAGLLIIDDADPAQLDKVDALIRTADVHWVALVAQDLTATPRLREFISDHLLDFITLPSEQHRVLLTLGQAWGMPFMFNADNSLSQSLAQADDDNAMLGHSAHMQQLCARLRKIAGTDAPVLISGASGTGKEAAAQSIHRQSARRDAPFILVNCGALASPAELAARLDAVQGGTLFLDDVGDLPADMQLQLLRRLQENAESPQTSTSSLRVIAATRDDLAHAVEQGRFREDLYYRLNVVAIAMPQLADRGEDIEDIAKFYFSRFARQHNRSLRGFSKAAMLALLAHRWPGNVRELLNRVQRATLMAEGRFIQPEDLGLERNDAQEQVMSLEDARAAAESAAIRRAMSQSRNQISRAAALLGVSRVTLYRLIDKYQIRTERPVAMASANDELHEERAMLAEQALA